MSVEAITKCLLCGADDYSSRCAAYEYSALIPGAQVCAKCAEKVANAYNKKHSGDWLTYPSPPRKQGKESIPRKLKKAVFERDEYRCKQCGTHINLSVDHIIPERAGGSIDLSNLQTLCMPCNLKKGIRNG